MVINHLRASWDNPPRSQEVRPLTPPPGKRTKIFFPETNDVVGR